ncbi:MAG: hypothetical protein AUK06_03135 [Parcubacteria group bacterium CG2_30_36_18]|uniref:Uncharacterized protein n=1 Tax=Candidatus Nealsonbacteria bacterium CG_4_9_14_0_8_um_filter_36_17 TaxID=1974693 RepID=A0A2M8DM19_9BACT|nr:MAG: hypothetical protein AUK06_03135 [Parcubacteria group bacterium CG2_30_36_18]PJB98987.1 MAG: hypothetical protein CO078_00235 [Candidatus Nealsonbacteria bacterium CG_4_9_14_0_8_um_filter_36_17]
MGIVLGPVAKKCVAIGTRTEIVQRCVVYNGVKPVVVWIWNHGMNINAILEVVMEIFTGELAKFIKVAALAQRLVQMKSVV